MATVKRTTRKSNRRNNKAARDRRAALKVAAAIYNFTNSLKPMPAFGDIELAILTRSQRLRIADLAAETGWPPKTWVRRAVRNFLEDEAPVWFMKARRAA